MPRFHTDTSPDIDITSSALVGSYTADVDRSSMMINVLADNIAGNGEYEIYVTHIRGGVGSAYMGQPTTKATVAAGITAIKFPSIIIPLLAADIVNVYLKGVVGDTLVDTICEFWELEADPGTITWPFITVPSGSFYGTASEVAALCQMWTRDGIWYDAVTGPPAVASTNPTLTQVLVWLDNVSSILNMALAGAGFTTPVVQVEALKACNSFVTSVVADLCHAANSSGRLYSDKLVAKGLSPLILVNQQIRNWVEEWVAGLKRLGVPWTPPPELPAFSVPPGKQL
jgi:hypothetical protein